MFKTNGRVKSGGIHIKWGTKYKGSKYISGTTIRRTWAKENYDPKNIITQECLMPTARN